MSFSDDNPNWESYYNENMYMDSVPEKAFSELKGLIRRASKKNAYILKNILNSMAEIIPCAPTQNWNWGFLEYDIPEFVDSIKSKVEQGRFSVFMDCISILIERGALSMKEANDYLEDNEIGYIGECDGKNHVKWLPIKKNETLDKLDEIQQSVLSVSQQAYDEIRRARKSLEDVDDERARKDALRSCVSAMEAVVKEYGKANDIGAATKNLKNSGKWGDEEIVKEGNSIFNTMHRLYPDLRHGSTEISNLTLNETEYWIGRILNFLKYMEKQHQVIDKKKSFVF